MEIRSRTTFSGSLAVILFLLLVAGQFKATVSCGGSRNAYDKKAPRTPLMKKASIPDLPETSLQASGPAKGKITKNSPEFDKLKPCYNGDIIFKDEERTGEDRMMSKRCREKLTNLSDLVKAQWPKVKLVVTEAWDEQGSHSKNSLHYEGRAVDLRLSDRDKSKLGLLGRMAWEAGFDWVFYEDERHIHASVREDGYAEEAWDGCFSADSTVKLESGVDLQLRDLKIGDKIQVMSREGKIGFSEIMIFADYKPNVTKVPYILIETERPSKKLSLTSSHLIFTSNSTATKFKAKQAGSVVPGEIVLVSNGSELVSSLVRRVSLIERTGMIAPVTIQGNLIVDEVLSSCYAKIMDHDVAHMAFAPLRLAYTYAFNAWSTEGFIQQGMHWYPQILIEINRALSLYKLS